jgi:hypothetical protein
MTFHISDRYKFFLLLFTLALLISAPIGYSHTYIRTTNALTDFNQHMLWAISLDQNGSGSIPPYILAHSGWQILLIFLTRLFGISFNFAGFYRFSFFQELQFSFCLGGIPLSFLRQISLFGKALQQLWGSVLQLLSVCYGGWTI